MVATFPMRWLVLFGVWIIYFTFGLVVTSLAPLVKLIEHDLAMSHAQMGTVMGAWQLVYILAALPCGILLDRLGSRWALLLGGLCVAASAYGRGQADSFYGLLAAVMLFGIGGPIISAGAPKVIAGCFDLPEYLLHTWVLQIPGNQVIDQRQVATRIHGTIHTLQLGLCHHLGPRALQEIGHHLGYLFGTQALAKVFSHLLGQQVALLCA